ncbi:MAG: hypothetical protein IPL26_26305 [Leptospiraceae bacterium]|nr:hypothetical protein [Leptospiraceae bacterium]MBK8398746.1 hypothetical protein [Leptospiraceae bacterium]
MDEMTNKIIEECTKIVNELFDEDEGSDKIWTQRFKRGLVKLAKQNGFAVYTSGVEDTSKDWNEWLWDLVWAEQKSIPETGEEMIIHLPLIAEIEWKTSYEEILQDFEKLVFGIADYKLYIFTKTENPKSISDFCRTLRNEIKSDKHGKYLLLGIPSLYQDREIYIDSF